MKQESDLKNNNKNGNNKGQKNNNGDNQKNNKNKNHKISNGKSQKNNKENEPPYSNEDFIKALDCSNRKIDENVKRQLAHHLIEVINCSIGLKKSRPPYNVHKDLMKKYLSELTAIPLTDLDSLPVDESKYQPMLRIFVESASNLPPMDADGSCDPYFRIIIPGSKPYISLYIENNLNPVWNDLVAISVHRDSLVEIEIWDHDPTSFTEIIRDFRGMRKLRDIRFAMKDLSEFALSWLIRINLDDKIGSFKIKTDDIPATGAEICDVIRNSYNCPDGSIKVIFQWAARVRSQVDPLCPISETVSFTHSLCQHARLIRLCLLYHCEREKMTGVLYESVDFTQFLFMPGVCLINQHRIQSNITPMEHSVIRFNVMVSMILETMDDVNVSYRTLLVALLANQELSTRDELIWNTKKRQKMLELIKLRALNKLFKAFINRFSKYFEIVFTRKRTSKLYLEFFQCTRLFARYDKIYPDCQFRRKLNAHIITLIINAIKSGLGSIECWEILAKELENFNDPLGRYWAEKLCNTIGHQGRKEIKKIFQENAKKIIQDFLDIYKEAAETELSDLNDQFEKLYYLTRKFENLIGGYCILESEPETSVSTRKPDSDDNVEKPDQKETTIFGSLLRNVSRASDIISKSVRNITNDDVSILPSSVSTFASEMSKMDSNIDNVHEIGDFNLSENFRFRKRVKTLGIIDTFSLEMIDKWVRSHIKSSQDSLRSCVNREIQRLSRLSTANVEDLTESANLENFIYLSLSNTIYFFIQLEYWDRDLLFTTIDGFFELVNLFAKTFLDRFFVERDNSGSLSDGNDFIILPASINMIDSIREKHIKKCLIEVLLDCNAQELWQCLYLFLMKNEIDVNQRFTGDTVEKIIKKIASLNLSDETKDIILICLKADFVGDKLSASVDELTDVLGTLMLSSVWARIHGIIENIAESPTKAHHEVDIIGDSFGSDLDRVLAAIVSKQSQANLLTYLKKNLEINITRIAAFLYAHYEEETAEKKVHRRLTKMQIITLIFCAEKFMQIIIAEAHNRRFVPDNSKIDLFDHHYSFNIDLAALKN